MARTVKLSKRRQRCLQSLTHASTVALVSIAFLLIYLLVSPFERGFYCTDETIRYPYKPDTVPLWVAGAYGVISAILIVLLTEFHLYAPCCSSKKGSGKSFLKNSAYLMLTSGRGIFIYTLGAASTLLITEIGKHTIGRLRPHFIDVCKPDWSRIQCFTKQNDGALPNYIPLVNASCTGDQKLIKEARLSFPSGHSSFTAYSMVFIIIYLEARLVLKRMHYFKSVCQLIAFIATWHTAMSRVSDFKHHYSDVIAGALIGISVAVFMTVVTGKRLWVQEEPKNLIDDDDGQEEDEEMGNGRGGDGSAAVEFEERPHAYNL